jgi:N-dimethylarginine dimethylaminohydrolase
MRVAPRSECVQYIRATVNTESRSRKLATPAYHHSLFPPEAEPAYDAAGQLERVWGRAWGASDEVSQLRVVLMRQLGDELDQIDQGAWDSDAEALVDPNRRWYWTSPESPDLALVHEQHANLVRTLEQEGVEVELLDPLGPDFTKAIYVRDPLLTVRGGALIARMASSLRRGEELSVLRRLGALGCPVLRTVTGTGLVEGGSFAKLRPDLAAFGTSIRCNDAGAEQLGETLRWLGIELLVVPLSGYSIHLDGHLGIIDHDLALVDAPGLPYWFLERLRGLGFELVYRHPDERWAVNALAVGPRRVIMSDDCVRTAERLSARGVEVLTIPYAEVHKNGGGIHCSTMELVRDHP